MKSLRTPEARFENLPDYNFDPHYCEVGDGLRLHYVDAGPKEVRTLSLRAGRKFFKSSFRVRKINLIPYSRAAGISYKKMCMSSSVRC